MIHMDVRKSCPRCSNLGNEVNVSDELHLSNWRLGWGEQVGDGQVQIAFPTGEQVASRAKALDGAGDEPVVVAQPRLLNVLQSGLESCGELGYQKWQRGKSGLGESVRASVETQVQRGAGQGVGSWWYTNQDYDEE